MTHLFFEALLFGLNEAVGIFFFRIKVSSVQNVTEKTDVTVDVNAVVIQSY